MYFGSLEFLELYLGILEFLEIWRLGLADSGDIEWELGVSGNVF